jgi:hypothetical protein
MKLEQSRHRGIQLSDPRKVAKYNTSIKEQLKYHKIPQNREMLKQAALEGTWEEEDTTTYEVLDRLGTEIMRHAEKLLMKQHSK